MTIVGVVLLVIATIMLLAALFGASGGEVPFDLGFVEGSISVLGVFLLGAATVLVFVSGLELLRSGLRRSWRRRRELRQARAVVAKHERHEQRPGETAQGDRHEAAPTSTTTDTQTGSEPDVGGSPR